MNNIEQYKNRFFNLMESTIGDVRPLITEQNIPSSATTEVCQRVPEPINGLQKYLHETPSIYSKYNEGSTNYVELPDGNYTFVNANANDTNVYKWVYVIDSKKCWTGYLFALGYESAGRIKPEEGYDPTQLTLEVINASPQRFDENIGGIYDWKESKYPKSPAKGVTIREQVSSGTTDPTTMDSILNDFTQKGYKDITTWYFSPEGVVYIPDGDYVGNGWGYSENILTKDGKDTGYLFVFNGAVRGERKDTVKVAKDGGAIGSTGGKIYKILLNDKILNSSGLRKK
jgi:hypothetical protein